MKAQKLVEGVAYADASGEAEAVGAAGRHVAQDVGDEQARIWRRDPPGAAPAATGGLVQCAHGARVCVARPHAPSRFILRRVRLVQNEGVAAACVEAAWGI